MNKDYKSFTQKIVEEISFSFLSEGISKDLKKSIETGFIGGAIFPPITDALSVLRNAVVEAITDIEEKGEILRRFLKKGPYWNDGEIPENMSNHCLTDEEMARAISFIYCHMVNCFQGRLAELLAIEPCINLLNDLKSRNLLSKDITLFIGDSILTERINKKGVAKGADFHIININSKENIVSVFGVGEVKSYNCSQERVRKQLDEHVIRAKKGLYVKEKLYNKSNIIMERDVIKISIVTSSWHLSRDFLCEKPDGASILQVNNEIPNIKNIIKRTGKNEWRIVLKWGREAIAQEAYALTFWYMSKLGEQIFANELPIGITNMTPMEAGQNAAKEMLYFSIARSRSVREEQRAIALFNMYGFGYSLGMNYKNKNGKRELLYIEALYEIQRDGIDKYGCKIWK